jgi:hypothetical protein
MVSFTVTTWLSTKVAKLFISVKWCIHYGSKLGPFINIENIFLCFKRHWLRATIATVLTNLNGSFTLAKFVSDIGNSNTQ